MLDHDQAAHLLDILDADSPVRPTAGEDHGDRVPVSAGGQAAEEVIDRGPPAMRLVELARIQVAVRHDDAAVGWDHVHMIGIHPDPFIYLHGGHTRVALQQLCHVALVLGMKVCDHDKSHACIRRHRIEKCTERVQATSRGADANNDQSSLSVGWLGRCW